MAGLTLGRRLGEIILITDTAGVEIRIQVARLHGNTVHINIQTTPEVEIDRLPRPEDFVPYNRNIRRDGTVRWPPNLREEKKEDA